MTPMRKLISQVTELAKFTKGVAEMRQRGRRTKGMEEAHLFVGMTQVNTNAAGVDIGAKEQSVKKPDRVFGSLCRRLKSRLDKAQATVATAHAIARVILLAKLLQPRAYVKLRKLPNEKSGSK